MNSDQSLLERFLWNKLTVRGMTVNLFHKKQADEFFCLIENSLSVVHPIF
ncbi:hypothetical protein STRDD10_01885 [Streptococcus sp. DD10]|nr:hypothetical protein STRDD10_01885 [Streptococcus sp. DD10]